MSHIRGILLWSFSVLVMLWVTGAWTWTLMHAGPVWLYMPCLFIQYFLLWPAFVAEKLGLHGAGTWPVAVAISLFWGTLFHGISRKLRQNKVTSKISG